MRTRFHGRFPAVTAGLAAAALVMAGCSSSGSPKPGATASGSASAAARSTAAPITIGMLVAETGLNSSASAPTTQVASAWEQWVNASGGLGGHPVNVIVKDTGANPVSALSEAKDMVQQDSADAVVLQDAASEGAVGQYLQSMNIPVIGAAGFNPAVWGVLPDYVTLITTPPAIHQVHDVAATAAGAKTIMSVVCAEVPSCAVAASNVQKAATANGLTFAGSVTVRADQPDYTAECLSIMQKKVHYIAMSLTPDVATRVAGDCKQQGYSGLIGVTALIQSQADKLPGVRYSGGIFAFPWWVDAPPVRQFRSVMARYEPNADIRSPYMTATWTALELFRRALGKPSGTVTPASVMDAYYGLKDETLGGLLPQPLTLTRGKGAPPVNCFWLFDYTSGGKNPTAVTHGRNGNGGSDGLASSCSS